MCAGFQQELAKLEQEVVELGEMVVTAIHLFEPIRQQNGWDLEEVPNWQALANEVAKRLRALVKSAQP